MATVKPPQDSATKAMAAQWPAGAKISAADWVAGAQAEDTREQLEESPALARRLAVQEGFTADEAAEALAAGLTEEHLATIVPALKDLWDARAKDAEHPYPHADRAALIRWTADVPDATAITKHSLGDTDWKHVIDLAITDDGIVPAGEALAG